jgi:probable rRNA maturation factor
MTVQYASVARALPTRAQLRRWFKVALHPQGVRRRIPGSFAATLPLQRDAIITLRIVDEAEGRELNKKYRGKDYATNVLTFVYDDEESTPQPPLSGGLSGSSPDKGRRGGVTLSGDVVICAPVVAKEACEQHKDMLAHYAHLTIHAALHLQGYEHDSDADAAGMEALETALMLKLRYPDPYRT